MIKHASSHGLSVLVCSILAALIVSVLEPIFPKLTDKMDALSVSVIDKLNLPMEASYFSIILIAVVLAAIWGIFFKLSKRK
ncbi:MAG: hypothetical protein ACOCP4_03165 [Candidatus Woesearchaeota archaeon]